MKQVYTFSLDLKITDKQALLNAARRWAQQEGFDSDTLANEDGEANINECLRMLLDPGVSPPGTEIQDSHVS